MSPLVTGLKHLKGTVTVRRDLTPDLWVVRVRPQEPIPFVPGQYLTLGLTPSHNGDGKMVERPYSVVSIPQDAELEFFFELVPDGKLTPSLHDVPLGGEVHIRPAAKGRFTLDEQSGNRNHFMVGTGTGVVPYISIARGLAAQAKQSGPPDHRMVILHAARFSNELGYPEELSAHDAAHDWFHYVPTVSRAALDPDWRGERGRVEDIARKYLDQFGFLGTPTTAYLCGNPHMIHNMEGILERAGFHKENIRKEIYWPD